MLTEFYIKHVLNPIIFLMTLCSPIKWEQGFCTLGTRVSTSRSVHAGLLTAMAPFLLLFHPPLTLGPCFYRDSGYKSYILRERISQSYIIPRGLLSPPTLSPILTRSVVSGKCGGGSRLTWGCFRKGENSRKDGGVAEYLGTSGSFCSGCERLGRILEEWRKK